MTEENYFKVEIISPEKKIFSTNTSLVTIPAYEGEMGILKNHIPIITFLRPGKLKVIKNQQEDKVFFAQDGIVEFFKNNLTILSNSVFDVKELSKEKIENLNKECEEKLKNSDLNDQDRYILSHSLDSIKSLMIN